MECKNPAFALETVSEADFPLERLLQSHLNSAAAIPAGSPRPDPATLVGKVAEVSLEGPLVDFAENPSPKPILARHTCPVGPGDAGREAVLFFEKNDFSKPIILGLLQPPATVDPAPGFAGPLSISVDGEQITFSARNEIVLRCGKASITLTRAGKVLIRGAYLLSRSSGANRIKGGSVQIN